jgi:hypothetical protein
MLGSLDAKRQIFDVGTAGCQISDVGCRKNKDDRGQKTEDRNGLISYAPAFGFLLSASQLPGLPASRQLKRFHLKNKKWTYQEKP